MISIMTVYMPQEHINYIEEWLEYHTKLGIEHFYLYDNGDSLYDNSKNVSDITRIKNRNVKNKKGVDHATSLSDARVRQAEIFKKYNVTHKIWSPLDVDGNVTYNQVEAFNDFMSTHKTGLCSFTDIDEFLVKKEEFRPCKLALRDYKSFHYYKSVFDCHEKYKIRNGPPKAIVDLSQNFIAENPNFTEYDLPISKSFINHYTISELTFKVHRKSKYDMRGINSFKDAFEYIKDTELMK